MKYRKTQTTQSNKRRKLYRNSRGAKGTGNQVADLISVVNGQGHPGNGPGVRRDSPAIGVMGLFFGRLEGRCRVSSGGRKRTGGQRIGPVTIGRRSWARTTNHGFVDGIASGTDGLSGPEVLNHRAKRLADDDELVGADEAEDPGGQGHEEQDAQEDEEIHPSGRPLVLGRQASDVGKGRIVDTFFFNGGQNFFGFLDLFVRELDIIRIPLGLLHG